MNRKHLLTVLFIFSSFAGLAQTSLWTSQSIESVEPYIAGNRTLLPDKYRVVKLNRETLLQLQSRTPAETGNQVNTSSSALFAIPHPDGRVTNAAIVESSVLSPQLQQQLSNFRTYRLTDPVTRSQMGRITVTPRGISALLFTDKGSVYITPLGDAYPDIHLVYYIKDLKTKQKITCGVNDVALGGLQPAAPLAGDCQLRTYRIAVAATGEYTTWAGSQANALGYITITVNEVTAIYERDMAIRFTLVSNTNTVHANAATDPYSTVASPTSTTLTQNHNSLNTIVNTANYDVGIVFNNGWNGGLASKPAACNAALKGRAAAGITFGTGPNPAAGPQGFIFTTTVAHEVAHQFNANHTFSATNGGCGGNENAATAWEVGGGSTIMAYAGVCEDVIENWYQPQADHYFHSGSLAEIQTYVTSGGGTCATPAALANTAPTVTVPAAAYSIPISTPFTLSSTGADADGNSLLYTWEQMNPGTLSTRPLATQLTGPNFRSYAPSASSSRTFPVIDSLIAGVNTVFEVLPSVGRTLNFRVTVRDFAAGGGCTDEDNVAVTTVASAGPFVVTSQSTPVSFTANGSNTFTVTWDVANTTAAPVSAANVNILFSVDGGYTYPYTLAANTPNDGSQVLTVPNLPTFAGRIKVQAANNIFFNINAAPVTINSACAAEGATFAPTTNISAQAGSPTLNLNLTPAYGSVVTPAGTLEAADPATFLAVNNLTPGNCILFSNTYRYDTYRFTPSVAGTYTFTRTGGSNAVIFNLYQGTFDPSNPCGGFIVSSGTYNGASLDPPSASISATLTPGFFYTLTAGTFNTGSPALPHAYSYSVTPPAGGNIYSDVPPPGAGFNYTYVIVDNATGNIVAIDPSADLSNAATFPGGTSYTIYGLSYSNTISVATLNAYVGNSLNMLSSDLLYDPAARCGNLSKNTIQVDVLSAIPATFLGLKASKLGNDKVQLTWKTASEQNNDFFAVERSENGSDFSTVLGKVTGRGNSNEVVSYSFMDASPLQKWNFYRIRQVDKDGRSSYSNIASLQFAKPGAVLQLFPNPANNRLFIEYSSASAGQVRIVIIDNKGSEVKTMNYRSVPGLNRVSVDVNSLSSGVYMVRTQIGGNLVVEKFVKQ